MARVSNVLRMYITIPLRTYSTTLFANNLHLHYTGTTNNIHMVSIYILVFLSILAVSLISLIGIMALSLRTSVLNASVFALVSLSVGALVGDAFFHLIPEAYSEGDSFLTSLSIIGGILAFFIIEKFLHWHHHHGLEGIEPE